MQYWPYLNIIILNTNNNNKRNTFDFRGAKINRNLLIEDK